MQAYCGEGGPATPCDSARTWSPAPFLAALPDVAGSPSSVNKGRTPDPPNDHIMIGMRTTRPAAAAWGLFVSRATVIAVALIAAFACAASADLTVKGDQAAWKEVTAALGKLNTLAGYRMKMPTPGGQTMIVEVTQGGNAMRATVQGQGGGMEMIRVGDQSRYRMTAPGAPPGWTCEGMPSIPRAGDLAALQGTVDVARGQDSAIDGEAMHVYLYTIDASAAGQSGTVKSTLYVGAGNGLPRRIVMAAGGIEQTADYYDYGASIRITLPPCGSASRPLPPGA